MYTIIRKDRGSRGGGVMFVIKSSKSIQVLSTPPSVEVLTVCVGVTTPTVYCLAYIPPNPPENYWQEFLDYIESLNYISSNIVLLGDFNCSDINWSSLSGQYPFSSKFCDVIFDLNLSQLIEEPTHSAGNTLDLVLTNVPENISSLINHSELPHPIPSDHFLITFDYSQTAVPMTVPITLFPAKNSTFLKVTMKAFVTFFTILTLHFITCLKTSNSSGPT